LTVAKQFTAAWYAIWGYLKVRKSYKLYFRYIMNPSQDTDQSPDKIAADEAVGTVNTVPTEAENQTQAVSLIRQRLDNLYTVEPDADAEAKEIQNTTDPLSKHQQYLDNLTKSGKSATDIKTAWHEYYLALSDYEKHQVWREFNQNQTTLAEQSGKSHPETAIKPAYYHEEKFVSSISLPKKSKIPDLRSVTEIKQQLLGKIKNRPASKKVQQHLRSLIFGLGAGTIVMLIMLFGFFNERFIAPFIAPSRSVSSTPIIISDSTAEIDPSPKVIIPKINVEIPVVYGLTSTEEDVVQNALEDGVVHYASTPQPGQQGNVVVFGHSSNNIFNQGDYKFAFVLLSRLENGDIFYLTKDKIRYAYRVYDKKIVKPTAVEVLGPADRTDTATLITCDPPGTTLNRLVVTGEQISPSKDQNVAATPPPVGTTNIIPSNAPSLWQRLTSWL
jgi:sortase A